MNKKTFFTSTIIIILTIGIITASITYEEQNREIKISSKGICEKENQMLKSEKLCDIKNKDIELNTNETQLKFEEQKGGYWIISNG